MSETTTLLSLADTVAKVGIGALISGIATFATTKSSLRHTEKSELAEDKRQLLVELARKLDEASKLRNKAKVSMYHKHNDAAGKTDFKPELQELRTALEAARGARTNAYLIGDKQLIKKIDTYFKILNDFLMHFSDKDPRFDSCFDQLENKCNEGMILILEELENSLKRIHT